MKNFIISVLLTAAIYQMSNVTNYKVPFCIAFVVTLYGLISEFDRVLSEVTEGIINDIRKNVDVAYLAERINHMLGTDEGSAEA